jgi:hypothetical protein
VWVGVWEGVLLKLVVGHVSEYEFRGKKSENGAKKKGLDIYRSGDLRR